MGRLKLGKTKPSDPNYDTAVQRFQRESTLLADVHHPALANFLGSGLDAAGHPYLALEWIEGPTLAKLLQQETRLSTRRALAIARQLASALAAIHAKGYIHSDIKPENVILQPDPHDPFAPPRARLMDFGVAGVLEADTGQTRSGVSSAPPTTWPRSNSAPMPSPPPPTSGNSASSSSRCSPASCPSKAKIPTPSCPPG